jgi:5-(carboxyamino)imidazole ribonucleotide synthase
MPKHPQEGIKSDTIRGFIPWGPAGMVNVQVKAQATVKRVGVVGGGQLAWMMAAAAQKLNLELLIQTPSQSDPAVMIATETVFASVVDPQATASLARRSDVVTFENEFVDLDALSQLAERGVCFRPSLASLSPLLSKYDQRCFLRDRNLPTPNFSRLSEAFQAGTPIPFPCVLKTCRNGYDGYGTFIVKTQADLDQVLTKVPAIDLLLEDFVPFKRELAVMVARSVSGEVVVYPIVQTHQENAVCRWVKLPIVLPAGLEQQIDSIARSIVEHLQFVGIVGIEFFETSDDRVLVNEIAPRTHNSGHYSLDASITSQFEQQLRAIVGLPLGNPALNCVGAVMVNLLGFESAVSDYGAVRSQLAEIPGATVHWYGKSEARVGRKLGHVTVCLDSASEPEMGAIVQRVEKIWYG